MIFPVQHEHHRLRIHGIAARLAHGRAPVLVQERLQSDDLLFELAGGRSRKRDLFPDETRGGGDRLRREPGSFRVVEIGHDEHRRRVLEEAVRHAIEREPNVL